MPIDVTAALLVSPKKEKAAMLVSQTDSLGIKFYSYANRGRRSSE